MVCLTQQVSIRISCHPLLCTVCECNLIMCGWQVSVCYTHDPLQVVCRCLMSALLWVWCLNVQHANFHAALKTLEPGSAMLLVLWNDCGLNSSLGSCWLDQAALLSNSDASYAREGIKKWQYHHRNLKGSLSPAQHNTAQRQPCQLTLCSPWQNRLKALLRHTNLPADHPTCVPSKQPNIHL